MTKCAHCGIGCDYLDAFTCDRCEKIFCDQHRLPENHTCAKVRLHKLYGSGARQDADHTQDKHECKKCGSTENIRECDICPYKFCGRHKNPKRHKCSGLYLKRKPHGPRRNGRHGKKIAVASIIVLLIAVVMLVPMETVTGTFETSMSALLGCDTYGTCDNVSVSDNEHVSDVQTTIVESTQAEHVSDAPVTEFIYQPTAKIVPKIDEPVVSDPPEHSLVIVESTPDVTVTTAPNIENLYLTALDLVNADREKHGFNPVSLSSIGSAQDHADDMLEYGYFSHWNTQGVKPYVTYAEHGGTGYVGENVAVMYWEGMVLHPENIISDLHWSMVYDDAESDWGHRDNVLDPLHTSVNFGIAYDANNLYFVQHFETDMGLTYKITNGILSLAVDLPPEYKVDGIGIYKDVNKHSLTANQLDNTSPYNQGFYSLPDDIAYLVEKLSDGWYYEECAPGKITLHSDDGSTSCTDYEFYEINNDMIRADVSKWSSASDGLYFMGVFVDNGDGPSMASLIWLNQK